MKKWYVPFLGALLCLSPTLDLQAKAKELVGAVNKSQSDKKIRINGTVTDENNEPLPGVNITIKGKEDLGGAITDMDGNYFVEAESSKDILVYSYIGFKTLEERVKGRININVVLEEDAEALDEVVVVGYGNQKKLSVVGSIMNLEPAKLRVGTSKSMTNNLAGQLAGVIAVTGSGEPGYNNADFWIRGISSYAGNTSPLVLVDGIERNLNDLDPAEIESFSILKDASASAMYGVRGANGVIIVNTKRGKVSAPSVSMRVEHSIQKPTKLPSFIRAAESMELLNRLAEDGGKIAPFEQDVINKTAMGYDKELYPDVNWLDAVTKDYAYTTRANLTVSGGSPILRYSLTGSVYNEDGIMAVDKKLDYDTSTYLTRYNLRANVDLDVTKTTLLRFNVGGYLENLHKSKAPTNQVFRKAWQTPPFVHPIRYSDGTIPARDTQAENPWAFATQKGYGRYVKSKIESLFAIEQNLKMITPGLKAKLTFSFDSYSRNYVERTREPDIYNVATKRDDEGNLVHDIISYGQEFLDHNSGGNYGNNSVYLETSLTYNRTFAEKHAVNGLFLYNQRSYDNGDIQPYRNQGIAGRASYTFDRRYVGEFNFGYNGSENFDKGKRFGFFPSFALGWITSEESFWEPLKSSVDKLKFRGSIGLVGNDKINGRRFAYITTTDQKAPGYGWGNNGEYRYNDGIREGEYGVPNLTWEKVLKSNIGFELGLFNCFEIQLDLFKEKRSDIFIKRKIFPTQIGFVNAPWANYGKVDNKGVDMSVLFNKQLKNDLFVSLRGNFTYAKNTIIEYDEPESVKGTYRSITGHSIGTLWGYEAIGLYTEDDFIDGQLIDELPKPAFGGDVRPGDIKYVDRNGDGVINSLDEGYVGGTSTPRIVYGFGGNLGWKQFDLGVFLQGSADYYRMIGGSNDFIPGSGQGTMGNIYTNYKDAWTEENPSQNVFWPRLSYATNNNNVASSTWWKKDMSFLRLKTIELGYSLPKDIVKKIHASNIRFYVSGNDLFYFSKFKLWDPELNTGNGLQYPGMRSVMFGIDLNF